MNGIMTADTVAPGHLGVDLVDVAAPGYRGVAGLVPSPDTMAQVPRSWPPNTGCDPAVIVVGDQDLPPVTVPAGAQVGGLDGPRCGAVMPNEVTAETLTDERIREFRDDMSDHGWTVICRAALSREIPPRSYTREDARARIVAAINARRAEEERVVMKIQDIEIRAWPPGRFETKAVLALHMPTGVAVVVGSESSRVRNQDLAVERLGLLLSEAVSPCGWQR